MGTVPRNVTSTILFPTSKFDQKKRRRTLKRFRKRKSADGKWNDTIDVADNKVSISTHLPAATLRPGQPSPPLDIQIHPKSTSLCKTKPKEEKKSYTLVPRAVNRRPKTSPLSKIEKENQAEKEKKDSEKIKRKKTNSTTERKKKDIARVGQRWTIAELLTRMCFFFFCLHSFPYRDPI